MRGCGRSGGNQVSRRLTGSQSGAAGRAVSMPVADSSRKTPAPKGRGEETAVPIVLDPPDPEDFTICPTCRRLQGHVEGRRTESTQDRVVLVQSCGCAWAEGRRAGIFPAPWPGFDLNEVWTLCYGCGAELLASGSRWAVWFCERCKDHVRRLHQVCGVHVVPIGRHSMMAGFGVPGGEPLALTGQPPPDPQAIARFVDDLGRLNGRIDHLATWAAKVVALNLGERALDGAEPVQLPRYMAVLSARPVDRRRRFQGLGRHFGVPEALLALVVAA